MYGYNIFHTDIINKLITNVRNNTNASTYIFEGHTGLHINEAASIFAKALVCNDPLAAPCCECSACKEAQSGNHPDIVYIDRSKDRATIGVDPIRAMIEECYIKPFYDRHKVFIISEGDLLTPAAQNAFLKIIEEPPAYAVFIIICQNAENLLETVRSRAITISFPPVDNAIVRDYIENQYPEETRIDFLVNYCEGIPTAADDIIKREDFEKLRDEALGLIPKILTGNKVYAFTVAKYFDDNKTEAAELCDMILLYLRDALVVSLGCHERMVNTDKSDKIYILAQKYNSRIIAKAIDEIITTKKMLDKHIKPSAAILHAALEVTDTFYSKNAQKSRII